MTSCHKVYATKRHWGVVKEAAKCKLALENLLWVQASDLLLGFLYRIIMQLVALFGLQGAPRAE